MQCGRRLRGSMVEDSYGLPSPGRPLLSLCFDTPEQRGAGSVVYSRRVWLKDIMSFSRPKSPRIQILKKDFGSSGSPTAVKLQNSKLLNTESIRKSQNFQNYLYLQALDGETNKFKSTAKANRTEKLFSVILEEESEKMKGFEFPEAGKFEAEDGRMEEYSENGYKKQDAVLRVNQFRHHLVLN